MKIERKNRKYEILIEDDVGEFVCEWCVCCSGVKSKHIHYSSRSIDTGV